MFKRKREFAYAEEEPQQDNFDVGEKQDKLKRHLVIGYGIENGPALLRDYLQRSQKKVGT